MVLWISFVWPCSPWCCVSHSWPVQATITTPSPIFIFQTVMESQLDQPCVTRSESPPHVPDIAFVVVTGNPLVPGTKIIKVLGVNIEVFTFRQVVRQVWLTPTWDWFLRHKTSCTFWIEWNVKNWRLCALKLYSWCFLPYRSLNLTVHHTHNLEKKKHYKEGEDLVGVKPPIN